MKRLFILLLAIAFSITSQLHAPKAENIAPISLRDGYAQLEAIQQQLINAIQAQVTRLTPQLAQEVDFSELEKKFILETFKLECTNNAIQASLEIVERMFAFVEQQTPGADLLPIKDELEKTKTFYTDWLHQITPALTASREARAMLEESDEDE